MKKFAVGCLIALALLIVVGGVGLYFAYDRFIKPGVELAGGLKEIGRLADIEKQVHNTAPFTAPQSGELTKEMVDRFIKVQQRVQSKLGPRMDQLKAKYDQLEKLRSSENRQTTFTEAAEALKDLSGILVEAKTAQVEALNQAGFSVKEYEWIRGQVYGALGMAAVGFDLKKVASEAKAGNLKGLSAPEAGPIGDVPEVNRTLVAPHEKQLKDWASLAFFGL